MSKHDDVMDRARNKYYAERCGCNFPPGHVCQDWHVQPVAARQGVHFTREQAEAVAALLNMMEKPGL